MEKHRDDSREILDGRVSRILQGSVSSGYVDVIVDNEHDNYYPDSQYCNSFAPTGQCNLRSAWMTCMAVNNGDTCSILLPELMEIHVNRTYGVLALSNSNSNTQIIGRETYIRSVGVNSATTIQVNDSSFPFYAQGLTIDICVIECGM